MITSRTTVLFFVAADWFFCSHFFERAKSAQEAGYDVVVVTHVDLHRALIEDAGFRLISIDIDRRSLNPFSALHTLLRLIKIYRVENPKIVHHVALKPILLGSLAANISRVRNIVNAVVGGGYTFTAGSRTSAVLRSLLVLALRFLLNPKGSKVIFENEDDLSFFVENGLARREDVRLIRGAGVDTTLFQPRPFRFSNWPLIVLPARLLWDKGIGDFVEAARILLSEGVRARFALVGGSDPGNRADIGSATLDRWAKEGVVELWGFCQDMPDVLLHADIVCLPSYREGLPKALLEAMAAGLPCIATDVPGCRSAVRDGVNGFLVPARDPSALARALKRLIDDPFLCQAMGAKGRERALGEFASPLICRQTLLIYEELLTGSNSTSS